MYGLSVVTGYQHNSGMDIILAHPICTAYSKTSGEISTGCGIYPKYLYRILADFCICFADSLCCDEEETLLRETCDRRRAKQGIPAEQFVHFDTPLTEEHEMQILRDAGFTEVYVDPTPEDSHIVIAKK